jgi:hypothetical protein
METDEDRWFWQQVGNRQRALAPYERQEHHSPPTIASACGVHLFAASKRALSP